jgi:hypothetical protein
MLLGRGGFVTGLAALLNHRRRERPSSTSGGFRRTSTTVRTCAVPSVVTTRSSPGDGGTASAGALHGGPAPTVPGASFDPRAQPAHPPLPGSGGFVTGLAALLNHRGSGGPRQPPAARPSVTVSH